VWAVNKILDPEQYASVWANIHGFPIGQSLPYVFGTVQIIVCLMIFAGYMRSVSYGLGLVMHGVTMVLILPSILVPFAGLNENYVLARLRTDTVPILAGFVALLLLRHRDHWSLDAWRGARKS
jgi:peptidoglycan/LPS O-acetylase OafA/YrhL